MNIPIDDIKYALKQHYDGVVFLRGGAYGEVYQAKCNKSGKECAIKMVPYKEEMEKNNNRELEALIRLNRSDESPQNIIRYFESRFVLIKDVKVLCIQMELCWKDLKSFVYENKKFAPQSFPAEDSLRFYQHILKQVLNGLIVIHSIGWIHRDIHLANILIVNPNPQHISDIHVKIADFGLARHIGILPDERTTVTLKLSDGWTVHHKANLLSCAEEGNLYAAPELMSGNSYDYKVDVYSTGIVLYFISRYPTNETEWLTELKDLVEEKLDINERLFYKDDNKLNSLIRDMMHKDADKRPSARKAKAYMFPEAKDSTDAQETQKIKFYARKENEQEVSHCCLKKFTFSALKTEIKRRTQVNACNLRQEVKINDEMKLVKIQDDEDVENIFKDAASQGHEVIIVVIEMEDDSDIKQEYISSGHVAMESVDLKST